MNIIRAGTGILLCCGGTIGVAALAIPALAPPTYTAAQANRGRQTYAIKCAVCHGDQLNNGEFGPPLKGRTFRTRWGGKPLDRLFAAMATMPRGEPGSLGAASYAESMAFVLSQNGVAPSARELPANANALARMNFPKP